MNQAKITFLRETLRKTPAKYHREILNLFLSMLAIDDPDFASQELIDALTNLSLEFPSDHTNYVINTLTERINYEKLSNPSVRPRNG